MDIDKSLDAMEGWALKVLEGITERVPPAKIIELCKNINAEGRKLEYRGNGIKHYEKKLTEAKELAKSVEKHFQRIDAARKEFRQKNPDFVSRTREDKYIIGYDRCVGETEYKTNFDNSPNKLGVRFYGGRYTLMNGRGLLTNYAYFITGYAKTEIESVKKAITEMRAAAQLIMSAMEKITKLDKKNQDQLKVKTEALYASVKKNAASMYNTSLLGKVTIGRTKPKVKLQELRFNPERNLNGEDVNSNFHLHLFEIIDYIKDHLKNCKKKPLS